VVGFERGKINLRPYARPYTDKHGNTRIELRVKDMNGDHQHDMGLIHAHLAKQKGWFHNGEPNRTRAEQWLSENQLTPHHHEGEVVLLVDRATHDIRHTGSAFEMRQQQD
jgi:hypothetical protein